MHGITPSNARNKGVQLKAFPKISFQISIKGDTEMEYRIENLDFELRIVGKSKSVKTSSAFKNPYTLEQCEKRWVYARIDRYVMGRSKMQTGKSFGVCGKDAAITDEEFSYFMGVRYDGEVPTDMETLVIPVSTWAVFPNIVDAWKRLYSEWVPTSKYELANLPCIECYYGPKHKPRHELWVPVILK